MSEKNNDMGGDSILTEVLTQMSQNKHNKRSRGITQSVGVDDGDKEPNPSCTKPISVNLLGDDNDSDSSIGHVNSTE